VIPLRFDFLKSRWVALAVAGMVFLTAATGCGADDDYSVEDAGSAEAEYSYIIPVGSGERIDQGEPLDLLPAELELTVGETIEIINEDDRGHTVGPFFVGAHETIRKRFTTPGEFEGICSVHSSGRIVLTVVS